MDTKSRVYKICDNLQKIATDGKMSQKHAAVIYINKNKILSTGVNRIYKSNCTNKNKKANIKSEHAEEVAINSLPFNLINNNKGRRRLHLLVIRINSKGEFCNSKPCYDCILKLKEYNIYKVHYSTGIIDKQIDSCLIKNIENNHFSKLNRIINYNNNKPIKLRI